MTSAVETSMNRVTGGTSRMRDWMSAILCEVFLRESGYEAMQAGQQTECILNDHDL